MVYNLMYGSLILSICIVSDEDKKKNIVGKLGISGVLPFGGFSWLVRLVYNIPN